MVQAPILVGISCEICAKKLSQNLSREESTEPIYGHQCAQELFDDLLLLVDVFYNKISRLGSVAPIPEPWCILSAFFL